MSESWFPAAFRGQSGRSALRVGDAERDEALRLLGEHFAAGRLDHAEYDDRSSRALSARTYSDLDGLFGDLPTGPSSGSRTSGSRTSGSSRPAQQRRLRRPPVLGLLLLVLVIAIVTGAPWILLVVGGALFCVRRSGHGAGRGSFR